MSINNQPFVDIESIAASVTPRELTEDGQKMFMEDFFTMMDVLFGKDFNLVSENKLVTLEDGTTQIVIGGVQELDKKVLIKQLEQLKKFLNKGFALQKDQLMTRLPQFYWADSPEFEHLLKSFIEGVTEIRKILRTEALRRLGVGEISLNELGQDEKQ